MEKAGGSLSSYQEALPGESARVFIGGSQGKERFEQQLLFDEVITVGCDWLEASDGNPIMIGEFERLFQKGFVSHSVLEVSDIFYGWNDFQEVTATYFNDRQLEKAQRESEILQAIQDECELGITPSDLLRKIDHYTTKGTEGKKSRLYRYEFIEGSQADRSTIIQRYFKYRLADCLLKDRPASGEVSDERKLSIALGFSVKTGKSLSGYNGSLRNSRKDLSDVDIERTAEELGIYDYVYPSQRSRHLKDLLLAGRSDHHLAA